jgi:hypothetical protein
MNFQSRDKKEKPSQEELERKFAYFSEQELLKTGKFYRFWASGRITKHFFATSMEYVPAIADLNIMYLPESLKQPNDSIVTSLMKALELRELLLSELRCSNILGVNEERLSTVVTLVENCETCGKPIEGRFYKGHFKNDGVVRVTCAKCGDAWGFCGFSVSSEQH